MAQNVKNVASKNLTKPKVAENSKSCQNSKMLPKIPKVAEKLPSNLWLSLTEGRRGWTATVDLCFIYRNHLGRLLDSVETTCAHARWLICAILAVLT